MSRIDLTPEDWERAKDILRSFPGSLEHFVAELTRDPNYAALHGQVTWRQPPEQVAHDCVKEANNLGILPDLLAALADALPGRPDARALADDFARRAGGSPFGGAPLPNPRHTLRPPLADFTGRTEEVDKLLAELARDGVAGISGVRGMGGIGKTELALVVADRLKARFPDAQLMFELQPGGAALPPEAILAGLIRPFAPAAQLPGDLPSLLGLYRSLDGRVLLLLDNALSHEQIAPLLPPPAGWAVIVTTRERFALRDARFTDLELLPEGDAVGLLRTLLDEGCRSDLRDADLAPLARACGCLPLALRVAASYLCIYPDEMLDGYLRALGRDRLGSLAAPGEPNVAAVLRTSVDRLERDDPALAERWRWLAVFPAPFDREAVAAVWEADKEETAEGMRALLGRSLVSFDTATRTYRLHDLLADLAGAVPLPDEVRYRHAWHYFEVGKAANDQYMQGGENVLLGLRAFDAAWPHLSNAWGWTKERAGERDAQRWLSNFPGYTYLILPLRLAPRAYIPILESALAASRALSDRLREGIYLGNLGLAYADLGEPRRAIEYYEQQLVITRETGDRRGEGNALGNLGIDYAHLGEPRRAIEYYEQQLAITREIGDRGGEGRALGNLGIAYAALGEPRRAIEHYEQDLVIAREIGDRRGEGQALGNLGVAYADLGEQRRAIEHYEKWLDITREIGDRRGEGQALGNLGNAYAALGEPRRAIEYYEKDLVIAREIGDRRGEGAVLWNMGLAYKTLGELPRVRPLWEEALRIYEAIESPWAAKVREWLAKLED